MMFNVSLLIEKYREFRNYTREYDAPGLTCLALYVYYFLRYGCSVRQLFELKLYESRENRRNYVRTTRGFDRSWTYASEIYGADRTSAWKRLHYLDFCLLKPFYPGLDAIDYYSYRFYEFRHEKRKTFITRGRFFQMAKLFNPGNKRTVSNKAEFNRTFRKYVTRRWIETENTAKEEFLAFCRQFPRVIAKPLSKQKGQGIFLADTDTDEHILELYEKVKRKKYLVEEIVRQHEALSSLNRDSVNTIRVNSVYKDGRTTITSAVLRMGNGSKPTDNFSAGGMVSAVDLKTGIVISPAIDGVNREFLIHPYSGTQIIGFRIPEWDKVLATVTEAHQLIPDLHYIGWDVVVTDDGGITFMEANTQSGVLLQQGPMLQGKKQLYDAFL